MYAELGCASILLICLINWAKHAKTFCLVSNYAFRERLQGENPVSLFGEISLSVQQDSQCQSVSHLFSFPPHRRIFPCQMYGNPCHLQKLNSFEDHVHHSSPEVIEVFSSTDQHLGKCFLKSNHPYSTHVQKWTNRNHIVRESTSSKVQPFQNLFH